MNRLLIRNALYIVTMDDDRTVHKEKDLLIEDGFIKAIGENLKGQGVRSMREIDATGMIVYPGLVNTHHHLYQLLTRNFPLVRNMELYDWLKTLYSVWKHIDGEMLYSSALVNMAEMVKFGCTTTSDQHYIFPKGRRNMVDGIIRAAGELGIRISAGRGCLNKGESQGGLPPDTLVESKEEILRDSERLINVYHDSSEGSMCQVNLAPCSPHSLTPDLMIECAQLARQHGVRLHTHLAVTDGETEMTMRSTGMSPLAYMESLGFYGKDVWYAHGNVFTDEEIDFLADTQTGVAHCSVSNQVLSAGVANVSRMMKKGVPVSLAVDGSTSNDSASLLAEIKSSYNIHRLTQSYQAPSPDDMLYMATRGGARCLGRADIGSLEVGKAADCFLVDSNCAEMAGALEDPTAIPAVVGINRPVDYTIINGSVVYEKGCIKKIDEIREVRRVNDHILKLRSMI